MKLVLMSLVSWLFGLLILSAFYAGQALNVTSTSMIMAALLFPLASAVVLNTPVFLIEFLAIGRTLAASDALACIVAFLLMGIVFGLGFVWNYQNTAL